MSRHLTIGDLSNPREAAFVAALFELGGPQHAAEAAQRAGYGKSEEESGRAAALLLSSRHIARAITAEIRARFDTATVAAFNTLLEVCANRRAPPSARISAAQEILNRSSIGPIPSKAMSIRAETMIETFLELLDKQEGGERDAPPQQAKAETVTSHSSGGDLQ